MSHLDPLHTARNIPEVSTLVDSGDMFDVPRVDTVNLAAGEEE